MIKNILFKEAKSVYNWARMFCNDENLSCWCAICSYELFKRFKKVGLSPLIFYQVINSRTIGHCFVRCCGYIVDVTARQFCETVNNIEVRKTNQDDYWFWSLKNCENNNIEVVYCKTFQGIYKILEKWPIEQNPFKWRHKGLTKQPD